jgi:hypothetical protein
MMSCLGVAEQRSDGHDGGHGVAGLRSVLTRMSREGTESEAESVNEIWAERNDAGRENQ